jgi:hypothetical protein
MVPYGSRQNALYRQQNKFTQVWEQTKVTLRLVITYFNWIWVSSRAWNYRCSTSKPNVRTLDAGKILLFIPHFPDARPFYDPIAILLGNTESFSSFSLSLSQTSTG